METQSHALLFARRGPACGEESALQAVMRTGGMLALRAWLTRCGLAACANVVAVTVGTPHGHEAQDALLLKPSAAWHTCGESAKLQHDQPTVYRINGRFLYSNALA
jgi:hypothetical protein